MATKKLKLTGSQTTDAYKDRITSAFSKLPGAGLYGSETTPAYKASLTAAFAQLPGAQTGAPAPDPLAAYKAQFQGLLSDATTIGNNNYGTAVANSIGDEGTTALDLGATLGSRNGLADSAATQGTYDWNNVEASNPFSKAALLVRSYNQQKNRTTNSLAAQGQLYSGARQNQQGQDTFGYQQGQDQLYKTLQGYLTGQARTRVQAGTDRNAGINSAGITGLQALLGS